MCCILLCRPYSDLSYLRDSFLVYSNFIPEQLFYRFVVFSVFVDGMRSFVFRLCVYIDEAAWTKSRSVPRVDDYFK